MRTWIVHGLYMDCTFMVPREVARLSVDTRCPLHAGASQSFHLSRVRSSCGCGANDTTEHSPYHARAVINYYPCSARSSDDLAEVSGPIRCALHTE